jgi:adenylyl-sulfate kinase
MGDAFTIWFTGLPASGKASLADLVAKRLSEQGRPVTRIDSGKERRGPLGGGLGFSRSDRDTNLLRHALSAQLLVRNDVVAVVSAVSPHRQTRSTIRETLGAYVEVHVSTPRHACIDADPRGDWAKALDGELRQFTGVDAPYEVSEDAEVVVDLSEMSTADGSVAVLNKLEQLGLTNPVRAPEHPVQR